MFRAGHGCADAINGCEFGDILNLSNANTGRFTEAKEGTSLTVNSYMLHGKTTLLETTRQSTQEA